MLCLSVHGAQHTIKVVGGDHRTREVCLALRVRLPPPQTQACRHGAQRRAAMQASSDWQLAATLLCSQPEGFCSQHHTCLCAAAATGAPECPAPGHRPPQGRLDRVPAHLEQLPQGLAVVLRAESVLARFYGRLERGERGVPIVHCPLDLRLRPAPISTLARGRSARR